MFSGGFTAEAAAAVCGDDALAGITRLVDKSLVVVETRTATRFRLLDSIHEYAARELDAAGTAAAMRDRHLDHCVAFAETAGPLLERDQDRWRTALLAEHDNLRAALEWGLAAPDPGRARRLTAALARFWFVTRHVQEGRSFLDRALAAAPEDRTGLQAALLSGAGIVAVAGGLSAEAARLAEQALELADALDDDATRGLSHVVLGAGPFFFTDPQASGRHAREAERFGLAAGDPFAVDAGCLLRARALTNTDRHTEAASVVQDRSAATRARGERMVGGFLLGVEVRAALFTGDLRRAARLGREAVATTEPLGDLYALGHTTVDLAWITGLRGDLAAAGRLMEPILAAAGAAGPEPELLKWFALVPGKLHLWAGEQTDAVRWFEVAARFAEPVADNWVVAQALPGLAAALRRQGRPDEARVHAERALRLATAVEMPHVRAEALDELAFLAPTPAVAEDLHHQALDVRVAASLWTFVVHSYDAIAGSAAAGDPRRAARVLGACDAARETVDHPRAPVERPGHAALLARLRAALGAGALAQAMADGASLSRDDLHTYLGRSRATRRRPVTGWDGLTRAEREVVALVADGLTNPQIGARLFMSRSTVKTHLAHVFAKLGITSRAELAATATRHTAPDA